MQPVETITDIALNAVFGLCVPAVSGGIYAQTISVERLSPMPNEKIAEFGLDPQSENYLLQYNGEGDIVVEAEGGACRVITGEGNARVARAEFLKRLEKFGGRVANIDLPKAPKGTLAAEMPIDDAGMVVISFYAGEEINSEGFYAASFRVVK